MKRLILFTLFASIFLAACGNSSAAGPEKAVEAYAHLAQKNNTMIVPGNMSEVASLIATAMALIKAKAPAAH